MTKTLAPRDTYQTGDLIEWVAPGAVDKSFGTIIAVRARHVRVIDLALFLHKHHLLGPVDVSLGKGWKTCVARGVPKRLRVRHEAILKAYPHLTGCQTAVSKERLTRLEIAFGEDASGNTMVASCVVETTEGILSVSEAAARGFDMAGALGEAAAGMAFTNDALRDQVVATHDLMHSTTRELHDLIRIRDNMIAEQGRLLDAGTRGEYGVHVAMIVNRNAELATENADHKVMLERSLLGHSVPAQLPQPSIRVPTKLTTP